MKKFLGVLVIAGSLVACNNASDTAEARKDSLDSIANLKKDNLDSMTEQKKDNIDSMTNMKKDSINKVDSAMNKK